MAFQFTPNIAEKAYIQYQLNVYGIHPYCKDCINDCKQYNAPRSTIICPGKQKNGRQRNKGRKTQNEQGY